MNTPNVISLFVIVCSAGTCFSSLPTCVEIADVHPKPFRKMIKYNPHNVRFIVTFSKPVTYRDINKNGIFLTKSLYDLTQIRPSYVGQLGSSLQYEFHFPISRLAYRRELLLVIDGRTFYTVEYKYRGYWIPYVPLSVFGVYYWYNPPSNIPPPIPMSPTPYCFPETARIYRRPSLVPIHKFKIDIVGEKSTLIDKNRDGNLELKLAVQVSTNGRGTIELPSILTILYKGHNVTILIPAGISLDIERSISGYEKQVTSEIVHDVMERIYHSSSTGTLTQTQSFPSLYLLQFLLKIERSFDGSIKWKTKHTKQQLHYIPIKHKGYFRYFTRSGTYSTALALTKKEDAQAPVWRVCNSSSTRSYRFGREGILYHFFELGPFYYLITPTNNKENAPKTIIISMKTIDPPKNVTVHGYNETYTYLEEIMDKYAILFPSPQVKTGGRTIFNGNMIGAVFVPKTHLHNNCNGIYLGNNLKMLTNDEHFCSRPFGHCVGLPFSSLHRYPDISPLGIEDRPLSWVGINKIAIIGHEKTPLLIENIPIPGVKILLPKFESTLCGDIWSLDVSHSSRLITEYESQLILKLLNSGTGGADVTANVKCTRSLLPPLPKTKTQFIGPGDTKYFSFLLDASRVTTDTNKPHRCIMNVITHLPTVVNDTSQIIQCSKLFTTFNGRFEDPCLMDETPLPDINLIYFVLPPSQRESTAFALNDFLQSPDGANLVYMKAITISLTFPEIQRDWLSNLNLLHVKCNEDAAIILEEEELLSILGEQQIESYKITLKSTLNFFSEFEAKRKIYYFAKKSWLKQFNHNSSIEELQSSGCVIQLFTNRPTRHCLSNIVNFKTVFVPLVKADISALAEAVKRKYWYLETIYGEQSDAIMELLLSCLGITVFMYSVTFVGHLMLFLYRKQLPNRDYVWSKEKFLRKEISKENKRWKNPQMYLEEGKCGPYYTLYDFKSTHQLDTLNDLKSMKVAGLLKFKEKELQVLFGHVKKVFVSLKKGTGYIILKASSGMYILKPENVNDEYRKELNRFYKRNNINIEEE